MNRRFFISGISLTAVSLTATAGPVAPAPPVKRATPPASDGLDVSSIDRSVDPCSDFYMHVCAGWMKTHPIPPDQSRWGRFDELKEGNERVLQGLLEDAAKAKKRDPDTQRIGDYYSSCMDERAIEKKGLEPLKPFLSRVTALKDKRELAVLLAGLHAGGVNAFFAFGPEPDMKNASMYIAATDQAGLGLPERDYYLRRDANSVEIRDKYVKHVARMFELAGDKADEAAKKAGTVMAVETALAKASLDIVSRRDPKNLYHKMAVSDLRALSPEFDWSGYFGAARAAPKFSSLNVDVPEFAKGMSILIKDTSLDDLKTYLTWQTLHAAAPLLPERFVNENFSFSQAPRSSSRAGNAAWNSPTPPSARRSAALTSKKPSALRPSSVSWTW
jgi:putative endopeptidase